MKRPVRPIGQYGERPERFHVMASNITLSAGVRQNLLSLQKTADLMSTTQNRLATGKKVNSALDNPTNFFTSSSLQARAGDLSNLLNSMSNGIKTLEAADNGLSADHPTRSSRCSRPCARRARTSRSRPRPTRSTRRHRHRFRQEPRVHWRRRRLDTCQHRPDRHHVAGTPASATGHVPPYTGGTLTINGTNVTIADDTADRRHKVGDRCASIAGITTSVSGSAITISNANGNVNFAGPPARF